MVNGAFAVSVKKGFEVSAGTAGEVDLEGNIGKELSYSACSPQAFNDITAMMQADNNTLFMGSIFYVISFFSYNAELAKLLLSADEMRYISMNQFKSLTFPFNLPAKSKGWFL